MSVHSTQARLSVPASMAYQGRQKIASLTAYIAPLARVLRGHTDMILVGDSTATVGHATPHPQSITPDMMS